MLSKMTNDEQQATEVTLSRWVAFASPLSTLVIYPPKRLEPGRGDPGRSGRVGGGKLRWDWGRIVRYGRFNLRGYVSSV